jgi:protein-disulfide isomerase
MITRRWMINVCAGLALSTVALASDACRPLSGETVGELTSYIKKKYELVSTTRLELQSAETIAGTCYRRLRVRSLSSRNVSRQMTFVLTPDQRFLTRDLMDVTVDPEESKRQEETSLRADLEIGGFPKKGPQSADVTITIFSDFQCPYCRRAAEMLNDDILPRISNPVQLVYRYLPLPIHPWARQAAELAACADQQSETAFWRVHDFLFASQNRLTADNLRKQVDDILGESPEFDMTAYDECADGHKATRRIEQDLQFAAEHDINVTPTLFVNGVRRNGLVSLDEMRQLIAEQSATRK